MSFLAKTRNPGVTLDRQPWYVIPGEDQESRSNQVCHSWRRPGIQESPWIASPGMSFLAKTRNPGVTKCVIPGEDQESRSHPGSPALVCHSWRRPGIQESPSVSFLAKTRNPGVTIMKTYYVYILASKRNGTLYIGVTNDLIKRVYEHKNNLIEGFTNKYKVHRLVYYETTSEITSALHREKQLKKWKRAWKIELIEKNNPQWKNLYETF